MILQNPSGSQKLSSTVSSSSKHLRASEASTMSSSQLAGETEPSPDKAATAAEKTVKPETPEGEKSRSTTPPSSSSKQEQASSGSPVTASAPQQQSLDESHGKVIVAHQRKKACADPPRRLSSANKDMSKHDAETDEVDIEGVDEEDDQDIVIGREVICSKCSEKSLLEVCFL